MYIAPMARCEISKLLQPACKKLGLFWAHHFFNPQLYFVVLQKNISLLVQLKKKNIQSAFATSSQVRCILSSKKINQNHHFPQVSEHHAALSRGLSEAYGCVGLPSRSVRGAHRHCTEAATGGIPLVPWGWLKSFGAPAWGVSKHCLLG